MNFEIVLSKFKTTAYKINGYLFTKHYARCGGNIYVRCRKRLCKARARIENNKAILTNSHHNHESPNLTSANFRRMLLEACGKIENINIPTRKIFESCKRQLTSSEKENLSNYNYR